MTEKLNLPRLLLGLALVLFAACSDDDNTKKEGTANVPEAVNSAFEKQFPNATNVTWAEKNSYYVASFDLKAKSRAEATPAPKNEAWYTQEGKCNLSELELSATELESGYAKVFAAWKATPYFTDGYAIDDIDLLQRTESADDKIIKIEIEKGDKERDLYFTLEGKLVKDVPDEDDSDDNQPCPQEIVSYIEKNYKGAVVVDFEKEEEKGVVTYEVEILTMMGTIEMEKELVFDKDYQFVSAQIDFEDEVLAQLIDRFLTPEQKEYIAQLTGESDPEEWDIEMEQDKDGIITIYVEDKDEKLVEVMKLGADFRPIPGKQ